MAIDLNLLAMLDVLLEEQNVTRAAARLGITQPAMSNALARMRDLLGDPILVRGSRGFVPTTRALALASPLRAGLQQVQRALVPAPDFNAATSARSFGIVMSDVGELVLLPRLLEQLRLTARRVQLHVLQRRESIPMSLIDGSADLAILPFGDKPGSLFRRTLFAERSVCLVRRKPGRPGRLTLEQFLAAPQVSVSPSGAPSTALDEALAKQRLTRNVVIRVSSFTTAAWLVSQSSLLAVVPSLLASAAAARLAVSSLDLPLSPPRPPRIDLVWHPRVHHDPASQWLRRLIIDVARNISAVP